MNIFEKATKNKYRFQSAKGQLSVEQLWDLPLDARGSITNLNSIAKGIAKNIRENEEESFVNTGPTRASNILQTKLDIVKHIIAYKINAAENAVKRKEREDERKRLMEILESKQDSELMNLSKEQIKKRIEELKV